MPINEYGEEVENAHLRLIDASAAAQAMSEMLLNWDRVQERTQEAAMIQSALIINKDVMQELENAGYSLLEALTERIDEQEAKHKALQAQFDCYRDLHPDIHSHKPYQQQSATSQEIPYQQGAVVHA